MQIENVAKNRRRLVRKYVVAGLIAGPLYAAGRFLVIRGFGFSELFGNVLFGFAVFACVLALCWAFRAEWVELGECSAEDPAGTNPVAAVVSVGGVLSACGAVLFAQTGVSFTGLAMIGAGTSCIAIGAVWAEREVAARRHLSAGEK
jgi:hypothetical protein